MRKIYVNDENVVECYEVDIDMDKYLSIIREIDSYFGKGDMKTSIGSSISFMNGKKLDVVGKREISPGLFEFQYYEFIPSSLSRVLQLLTKIMLFFPFSHIGLIVSSI